MNELLLNFYRKVFCQLYELLHDVIKLHWKSEHQSLFRGPMSSFTSGVVLGVTFRNKAFFLTADFSYGQKLSPSYSGRKIKDIWLSHHVYLVSERYNY